MTQDAQNNLPQEDPQDFMSNLTEIKQKENTKKTAKLKCVVSPIEMLNFNNWNAHFRWFSKEKKTAQLLHLSFA